MIGLLEEFWLRVSLLDVTTTVEWLAVGGDGVGVGWGDPRSSVDEDMRLVRFFGGRDLLRVAGPGLLFGGTGTAALTALVGGGGRGGDDTGDKAGLGVEQLDAVENRFVGVIVEADVDDRLVNEFRRLSSEASPPLVLLLLCDFEWRISRFIRPEEKLHK